MIAELGFILLCLSGLLALNLALLGFVPFFANNLKAMATARLVARLVFLCLAGSFACLVTALAFDDFSVLYVANHSNRALPMVYKISAAWGGHEGSFLLWILMLAGWMCAVSFKQGKLSDRMLLHMLATFGAVIVGFVGFITLTSDPFARLLPIPAMDGQELNPLLQDPALIIHPPTLYMGYVGCAVSFAFAVAAMLSGQLKPLWLLWLKPWVAASWAFLTLGIALGSWWAYYELGWGGWWFWDPVENASLMPWLVNGALLHSLSVSSKRQIFKAWTLLLAVLVFALSLLGTFLVRSGVLTSVHSFASDPERGLFILGLLGLYAGGALLLFAFVAPKFQSKGQYGFFSRENGILLNNILFLTLTAIVMIGTLYPLIMAALDLGRISIGEPYFNSMSGPVFAVMAVLAGLTVMTNWKKTSSTRLMQQVAWGVMFSSAITLVWVLKRVVLEQEVVLLAVFSVWLAAWILAVFIQALIRSGIKARLNRQALAFWSMHLAHLGFAISLVGVVMASVYSTQLDLKMESHSAHRLDDGNLLVFRGVQRCDGPNYAAECGLFELRSGEDSELLARLLPERRRYVSSQMPMTEVGLHQGLFEDLYVVLGEPIGDQGAWAIRVHRNAYVRWIWGGACVMAFGLMLSIIRKRQLRKKF